MRLLWNLALVKKDILCLSSILSATAHAILKQSLLVETRLIWVIGDKERRGLGSLGMPCPGFWVGDGHRDGCGNGEGLTWTCRKVQALGSSGS